MVITPHDSNWHAVRLKDDTSAAYLNDLLRNGWYVMDVGVPGLPTLAFVVPLEPRTDTTIRWRKPGHGEPENIVVIVLHKGKTRGIQKGIILHREESGYLNLGSLAIEPGWKKVIVLEMESGAALAIVEKIEENRGDS